MWLSCFLLKCRSSDLKKSTWGSLFLSNCGKWMCIPNSSFFLCIRKHIALNFKTHEYLWQCFRNAFMHCIDKSIYGRVFYIPFEYQFPKRYTIYNCSIWIIKHHITIYFGLYLKDNKVKPINKEQGRVKSLLSKEEEFNRKEIHHLLPEKREPPRLFMGVQTNEPWHLTEKVLSFVEVNLACS